MPKDINSVIPNWSTDKVSLKSSLSVVWVKLVSYHFDGFQKACTRQEQAVISRTAQSIAAAGHKPPEVMGWVIENWAGFCEAVRIKTGNPQTPGKPAVLFYAKHYDVALQLIAESKFKKTTVCLKVPASGMLPTHKNAVVPKIVVVDSQKPATFEEAMAIINGTSKE